MAGDQSGEKTEVDMDDTEDLFDITVAMDPSGLIRVKSLKDVLLALVGVNCKPGKNPLVLNIVRTAMNKAEYCKILIMDPEVIATITCSAQRIFLGAPDSAKISLSQKYAEFNFEPGCMYSEWLETTKLDLKVRSG